VTQKILCEKCTIASAPRPFSISPLYTGLASVVWEWWSLPRGDSTLLWKDALKRLERLALENSVGAARQYVGELRLGQAAERRVWWGAGCVGVGTESR
jgi:hypothetical protein